MKKIVLISSEIPFPPLHGGRVETWRRIEAFKKMGFKLFLICWSNNEKINIEDKEILEKEVDFLIILNKKNKLYNQIGRLLKILIGIPWQVSARINNLSINNHIFEKINNFKPDFILLDSLYGGDIALKSRKKFNAPLFYRSHNIEHKYFKTQFKLEKKIKKKILIYLASLNLRRYEFKIVCESKYVLDISLDDMKFWNDNGFKNVRYLPPLANEEIAKYSTYESSKLFAHDILFLGNLNTPNNVYSLMWLINNVMPIVWCFMPKSILTIAGSSPCNEILNLVKDKINIKLMPNVVNIHEILNNSKILVNPTLGGSGVNIKTIDMLMTKRPIVTTSFGVAGLSQDIKEICYVCDSHDEFADKLIFLLSNPLNSQKNGYLIDDNFSFKSFKKYCLEYFN